MASVAHRLLLRLLGKQAVPNCPAKDHAQGDLGFVPGAGLSASKVELAKALTKHRLVRMISAMPIPCGSSPRSEIKPELMISTALAFDAIALKLSGCGRHSSWSLTKRVTSSMDSMSFA